MQKNIAVVGAGIAGLNSALYLAEKGHQVTIYEATDRIGGRARSFKDTISGDIIDNGQHIMIGAYYEFLKLLEKIDSLNYILKQKSLITKFKQDKTYILDTSKFPGKLGFLYGFTKFDLLTVKQKVKVINFYMKITYGRIKVNEVDTQTFLLNHNQDQESINLFWEPLIISALNTKIDEASSKVFINVLKQGFFKNKKAASIYIPQVDFGSLFSNFYHKNIKIKYNHTIKNINFGCDLIESISDGESEITADEYLFCIPPYLLSKIANNYDLQFLNKYEYSPIVSIYLWFETDDIQIDFEALVNGNYDWIFNKSIIDEHKSQFAQGFYTLTKSTAENMMKLKNSEILELALEDMYRFYGINKAPMHYRVYKEKFATIKCTPKSDGFRPPNRTNFKNLKVAGEWTNTGFPSTLEGAAISGREAAKLIDMQ